MSRLHLQIRRLTIAAAAFAIVALLASPAGAVTRGIEMAESTSAFTYGGFSISASPNPARPGDSVTVSFSANAPSIRIGGCSANFAGNAPQACSQSGEEWSAVLQVPDNAQPGSMPIEVNVSYFLGSDDVAQDAFDTIPFEVQPPPATTEPPSTTEPPATTEPPSTPGPPSTAGPPSTPGPPSTVQVASPTASKTNLPVGLLVVLVLVGAAVAVAVRQGLHRRLPGTLAGQVQARMLAGLPAAPRIEELGNRSAWVVRISPHHDPVAQRIEETHR